MLVVEDDLKIAQLLEKGFREAGFAVDTADDGEVGLKLAVGQDYDIIISDVMLPGLDGFSLVEELRKQQKNTPVIFLSARRASAEDRVEGLSRGGDDYVVKPFLFSELLMRVHAVLRRTIRQDESKKLKFEDLEIDLINRTVRRGNTSIELHQKEFALLEVLMRHRESVLTKSQILDQVWKYDFDPQTNVVDVLIHRLRQKIDKDFPKKLIKTIRGVGYAIRSD